MRQRYPAQASAEKLTGASAPHITPLAPDVLAAAQRICQDYRDQAGNGVPAIAAKMSVQPGTLYNKLNPGEGSHHKLTLQDLALITIISGDIAALQAYCRTLNCVCFPIPDYTGLADGALVELINRIYVEGGHFHAALAKGFDDGTLSDADYLHIERESLEWVGAIVEAKQRLRGMVSRG